MLYVGEGSKREQWRLLHSLLIFSHFPRYAQSNWALLVLIFPDGWVCIRSRPLWVSPTNSPVRLGVFPASASTPTGVFNQWFEALFPHAAARGCTVCHWVRQLLPCWPAAALLTLLHNPPPRWVRQLWSCLPWSSSHHLARSPLHQAAHLHPSYRSG